MTVHTIMQIPVYNQGRLHGYADVWHDDYDRLNQWLWRVNPQGYVLRYTKGEGTVRMSREIMGLGRGDPREVDHIDRNPLNNCRSNLRITTHAQNQQNRSAEGNRGARSKFRGVSYDKRTNRWTANVVINRQNHWLGRHDTEEEAGRVAAEFRKKHMTHTMT